MLSVHISKKSVSAVVASLGCEQNRVDGAASMLCTHKSELSSSPFVLASTLSRLDDQAYASSSMPFRPKFAGAGPEAQARKHSWCLEERLSTAIGNRQRLTSRRLICSMDSPVYKVCS